jgi:hypothetical protein
MSYLPSGRPVAVGLPSRHRADAVGKSWVVAIPPKDAENGPPGQAEAGRKIVHGHPLEPHLEDLSIPIGGEEGSEATRRIVAATGQRARETVGVDSAAVIPVLGVLRQSTRARPVADHLPMAWCHDRSNSTCVLSLSSPCEPLYGEEQPGSTMAYAMQRIWCRSPLRALRVHANAILGRSPEPGRASHERKSTDSDRLRVFDISLGYQIISIEIPIH